jgi:hypothetical protein
MSFRITALDPQPFVGLFAMSDDELRDHLCVRVTAKEKPGFPCRVSMMDAEVGEELLLVNYEHQAAASPFRAAHAIFIRKGAERAHPGINQVPELLASRMLSLRVFDDQAMIIRAELIDGKELANALDGLLADPAAAYVHIHYAKYGCYAARAERA